VTVGRILDIDDDTVDVRTIDWANTKNYDKNSLDEDKIEEDNKKNDDENIKAEVDVEVVISEKEITEDMDISDVRAVSTEDIDMSENKDEGWDGVDTLPIGRTTRSVNKTVKNDDEKEGKNDKSNNKSKKFHSILNRKSTRNKRLHGPNAWVVVKWVCLCVYLCIYTDSVFICMYIFMYILFSKCMCLNKYSYQLA
jgi:hypothetical protein